MCQPTYILVCYKWHSWSACNIMHAPIVPARISQSATRGAAGQLAILCVLQPCQLTYILVCYKQCSWPAGNNYVCSNHASQHTPLVNITWPLSDDTSHFYCRHTSWP